jgi:hypothetical protein
MEHLNIGLIAACSLAFSAHASTSAAEEATLPGSMNEFVNWHLDRGGCGTWSDTGVTEAMWVGIPAGLKVVNTQRTWYDVGTNELYNSHHMATEDGRVISTGSNVMTWDADRKVVVSAGSGFDMGKPYHGNSVLVGMTDDAITWEYTERSQGKVTVYENVVTYTGTNTRTSAVKVKGGDGAPWGSEATRANPCMEQLKGIGLAGTWAWPAEDGAGGETVVSWVGDGHILKYQGFSTRADGSKESQDVFVWYWDPVHDHIATLYMDGHGAVIHGKIDSITRNGDAVTIVASHEGSRFGGLTMSTQATQVITPKTLTTTFQNMSLDGVRHPMSWSEGTRTIKRVE